MLSRQRQNGASMLFRAERRVKRPRRWRAEAGQQPMQRLSLALAHFERSRLVLVPQSLSPPSASLRCAAVRVCRRQWSSCVTLTGRCVAASLGEMSSSCSGGSASSSGGRQLGARPKIGRLPFEQQQTSLSASNRSSAGRQPSRAGQQQPSSSHRHKEWNANWNSVLSAQGDEGPVSAKGQHETGAVRSLGNNNNNGQPPSAVKSRRESRSRRDGMSQWTAPVSRGFSDPNLAVVQPASGSSGAGCRPKSPELFHSHHYHARRQRDRLPVSNSRSGSDLHPVNLASPASSSSLNSLNSVHQIKDSGRGISSIWARWFGRNNSRTSAAAVRPFSAHGAGSRSHSVENSPVVIRRRHPMTGSSGRLDCDRSDSLSTESFSFIRTDGKDPAMTLRRKYGLMACSNESTDQVPGGNNIEGDAIRAMRTQWETHMRHMDQLVRSGEEAGGRCSSKRLSLANNSTARKKRPAPQPPPSSSGTSSRHSTRNRSTSVASGGFAHVPGKRKAPSPPRQTTNSFNIVAPPPAAAASALPDLTESIPAESKWSNDLNCNLLPDASNKVKVFRYEQKKVDDCPHNDILKLEGGVLRPLDPCGGQKPEAAAGSTMDSNYSNHRGMMTLPLKPWYKRGRNNAGSQVHHHHSSANAASRSKWKDAALLHHGPAPAADECGSWAVALLASHHLHPPESNTIRSNDSSTVSPGGSTRSDGSSSVCSSDGSKGKQQQQQQQHRRSLLVNISQLDREATEIIQRERARESQRRRLEDDKFYCHHNGLAVPPAARLATVADVADESAPPPPPRPPPGDPPPPPADGQQAKCARQLIDMFNSLGDSPPPPSINSPAATEQTTAEPRPPQRADANYKSGRVTSDDESPTRAVDVPADGQRAATTTSPSGGATSSALLFRTTEESSSIRHEAGSSPDWPVDSNAITRLRVTVAAASPETIQQQQQQQQSIFNPKVAAGGARPKQSPSVISCPAEDQSPLVNGYSEPQQPQQPNASTTNGWACPVCTLVNSDARLWCEACTALKPRQLSRATHGPAPVARATTETIPAVRTPEATSRPTQSTTSGSSSTAPGSPGALRQARLAFFLNGLGSNNKPEAKGGQGDEGNSSNKRHSQHGGIKVSSSCQTQPLVPPSLTGSTAVGSQRPVSMLGKGSNPSGDSCASVVANKVEGGDSGPAVSPHKRVVAPAVFKDVNPTNFALVSPSRTQLSQYLQQQQASKSRTQAAGGESGNDAHKSTDEPADEVSEDKRVEVMLLRLEEAIAAGQFDKAAVLAKELAAIKRTPSPASPSKTKVLPVDQKPVAAPRSVVPVVVSQQQQCEPVKSSPVSARKPKEYPAVAAPLPAKRSSHLASPSPLPRKSIRPEEKAEEATKPNEEEETPVTIEPPAIQSPIQPPIQSPIQPPVQQPIQPKILPDGYPEEPAEVVAQPETASAVPAKAPSAVSGPEVAVRTKRRSVKVSSGQQTTLTFQKKPSADAEEKSQRRTRSCIVDDTFSVEVFIEDRSTHSGPFQLPVRPATTLLELKERMAKLHDVKAECQRWILGRRLADQDRLTLNDYDICPSNSSLFLYVLDNPAPAAKPKTSQPSPQPGPARNEPRPDPPHPTSSGRKYYNHQEDRYSTCEEEDDEPPEAPVNNQPVGKVEEPPLTTTTNNIAKDEQQPAESDQGATGGSDPADGWICPGCTSVNPTPRSGCKACAIQRSGDQLPAVTEPKVDYKKWVDLLDQSDVVTNADTFDCPICLMTVPAGVGVTLRECLHNFCRDCLAHVIEFSDEATVTCPFRDDSYACDAILQELEIKNLVDAKLYEKHLERSMRLAEKAMKNTFHCQTADCPGWAVIEEDNVNVFRCPVCRKSNCLTCQAIHEGANCKEFQDRVNQSAETDEDARRTKEMIDALVASGEALSCPQCQVVLMKRWGCDWVRCSVCRTEICWVTKQNRWGPKGKGDTSGGCRCGVDGVKCHPLCNYCH